MQKFVVLSKTQCYFIVFSLESPVYLQSFCVVFINLEGDNLALIFTSTTCDWHGIHADGRHFFGVLLALVVLPSVWLRDLRVMSVMSYISGFTAPCDFTFTHFIVSSIKTAHWLAYPNCLSSWWCLCNSCGFPICRFSRCFWKCRIPYDRESSEVGWYTLCYWDLWLLLCWALCISEYIPINVWSHKVQQGTVHMVGIFVSSMKLILIWWLYLILINEILNFLNNILSWSASQFAQPYMVLLLSWDISCLETRLYRK